MSGTLSAQRAGPASGNAGSLVVLLHGYGANGADLLGLSEVWGPNMPDTLFVAPDAPSPCDSHPSGRQWFPIQAAGSVDRMDMIHIMIKSFNELNEFRRARRCWLGFPRER